MSRYGKTVKIVESLYNKVENCEHKEAVTRRQGEEVYKVAIHDNTLTLVHYGTTTLVYDIAKREIVEYDGFSNSDRDSLNTVLDCLYHNNSEYFRVKQGELILVQE